MVVELISLSSPMAGLPMRQLELFKDDHPHKIAAVPDGVVVEERSLNLAESTFVGGANMPVHRWYKLRPSFSPLLVRFLYKTLVRPEIQRAFDPFSGAGTTLVECKRHGIDSWGIEINPFLAKFTALALDWSATPDDIQRAKETLIREVQRGIVRVDDLTLERASVVLGVQVPRIHDPTRWWRPDILRNLLAAKRVLYDQEERTVKYRIMWLTLSTICIEVANIKRLHPTLSFHDRSAERINVLEAITEKINVIAHDLAALHARHGNAEAFIIEGDSLKASQLLQFSHPVALITSPPYPNRYSYVWETRPHLYMMDLINDPREAAQLDLSAPGGTWGVATSILTKGEIEPRTDCLRELLRKPVGELRRIDNLMANYVVKYFNMMDEHLDEIGKLLKAGSSFAYVVGNSRIKGIDIPTESIMAHQLIDKRWASLESMIVFRRRIGKKALFETAVIGVKHD